MKEQVQTHDYFERKSKGLFKRQKVKLKHRLGWLGIPQVIPYRGFGALASQRVFVNGLLSEDKGLEKPLHKNSWFRNFLSMLKRYSGDQIPGARVAVQFEGTQKELKTSESGLFSTSFALPETQQGPTRWMEYKVQLLDKFDAGEKKYAASSQVLIPGNDADFGIISDIDDTIMVSHSTHTLRKLRLLLTHNSRTRKPFPGVESFYRALHSGKNGKSVNPFFYISSSEWNLYDLIDDFCSYNNFPKGVFLLREIKPGILNLWKQGGRTHEHKYEKIVHIFNTYPHMKFVLVGDNGQHDPEIYSRVAGIFPKRIGAIYIRTISKRKDRRMQQLIADMEKIGVQMVFTPDTINAAQHASNVGLISRSSVDEIIESSLRN